MKRFKKSLSSTPVQKTTMLNFFPRTPSTPSTPSTQSTPQLTPLARPTAKLTQSTSRLTQLTPRSTQLTRFSRPAQSSLITPSKLEIDLKETECPACQASIPIYKLNDHLDIECATSLHKNRLPSSKKIEKADFTSRLNRVIDETERKQTEDESTPSKKVFSSSSKIYSARKEEIAGEYIVPHPSQTDVKKYQERSKRSKVKRQLFTDIKPMFNIPYYLENFRFSLKSTFNEPVYQHLFIAEDRKYYDCFQSLSLNAQKLYVRLFTRKFQWRRREKIRYDDIDLDLTGVLEELCSSSLLVGFKDLQDLTLMVQLLFQPELKQLFKELKLNFNTKGNAVQDLMKHCQNQPCLKGIKTKSMSSIIMTKAERYLKECYKLNEEPRRVFLRMCMLSSLHQRQEEEEEKGQQHQMFTMLQVTIGRKVYPSYRICRQRPIFQDRDSLISYEGAVLLETQVREALENQNWETVVELTDSINSRLPEAFRNNICDVDLPLFLRRFTAGAVHVYILNKRIEALQRLKQYREAVDLLSTLIEQESYLLTHRGHWYERLVLNMEQHLKNPLKALELIKSGLEDAWVSPSHKLALSQRATRICQTPKLRDKFESFLADLPLIVPSEPRNNTITGRSLPSETAGRKSVFIRGDSEATLNEGDITLCSVEELVLQHYLENGYTHGLHAEGSTMWSVIGLLFWDIIYDSNVSDVFLSPFQAYPLDFDSLDFYTSRQENIVKRLDALKNWSTDEITAHITNVWNSNHGATSLVSWDRFQNVDHVNGLVECISPEALAGISERVLQNYRHYRSGFPDLTLWNPQAKKWIIVEVKGPNDRLSTKQILWLDFLTSIGVQAEVCYVQAVGAKRMGATVQTPREKTPKKAAARKQLKNSPPPKRLKIDDSVSAD